MISVGLQKALDGLTLPKCLPKYNFSKDFKDTHWPLKAESEIQRLPVRRPWTKSCGPHGELHQPLDRQDTWSWCGSEYVYQQITWNLYISPLLMLLSTVPPNMYMASEITAAAWKSLPLGNWGKKIGNRQKEKDTKGKGINKSLVFC